MVVSNKNVNIKHLSHLQQHQFFWKCEALHKCNPIQMGFVDNLVLIIVKGYMPLYVVESL
jgi:hypothetical protein